jgi:hypothetical protein
VDADRSDEQQCGPVVDLADEQPAPDVEADVEGGRVGLRHRDALERHVAAVVSDFLHRWVEEEGQEHAGEQDDDE